MPKESRKRAEWLITKGQRSRWQKEQRWRRITVIIGCVVVAVVVAVLSFGFYATEFRPLHQTVLRVNDRDFDMAHFVRLLRLYGPSTDSTVYMMENNELLAQAAQSLGIVVTGDEVSARIETLFSPPDESEDGADKAQTQQVFHKFLGDNGFDESTYRDVIAAQLLAEKLQDHVAAEKVPQTAPQVRVEGIVVMAQEEFHAVQRRLDSGEAFASLAREFSQYGAPAEKAADLGWLAEGIMGSEFDAVAFDMEPGDAPKTIVEEEGQGYWLIRVLEKAESRALETSQAEALKSLAFADWFAEQREKATVEDYLNEEMKSWALKRAERDAGK